MTPSLSQITDHTCSLADLEQGFVSLTPLHTVFVLTSFWSGCLKVIFVLTSFWSGCLKVIFVLTSFWSGCLKVITQRYCFCHSHVSFRSLCFFVVVAHNYMLLPSAIVLFQLSALETFHGQSFSVVALRHGSISASLFFKYIFIYIYFNTAFSPAFVSVTILYFWPLFKKVVGNTTNTFHQSVKWDL